MYNLLFYTQRFKALGHGDLSYHMNEGLQFQNNEYSDGWFQKSHI